MDIIKSIKLTKKQWSKILQALHEEYPTSVLAIRSRMRVKLGFTPRNHQGFIDGMFEDAVYLDFYSEQKRTMFLLKFGEYLDAKQKDELI